MEAELQEAHSKIKELEIANKEADKPVEKKVTFGTASSKKDAEALKAKQDELDKLKLTMKKVGKMSNKYFVHTTSVFWYGGIWFNIVPMLIYFNLFDLGGNRKGQVGRPYQNVERWSHQIFQA